MTEIKLKTKLSAYAKGVIPTKVSQLEQDIDYTTEAPKDDKIYAECVVTVKEPVTAIELSETQIEMAKGDKKTITAKVMPENAFDKTVIWTSGDEKIAVVENGVITAVAAGTVEITVTSTVYGVSAKCRITVA